jgi:Tannase and feruloyl esterase
MFPLDFDGIIAGGAASGWTHAADELLVYSENLEKADIQGTTGAAILTQAQNATTAACDALDGVAIGIQTRLFARRGRTRAPASRRLKRPPSMQTRRRCATR